MLNTPEEAFSFDDLLLVPNYSDVLPKDVDTGTRLTRNLTLNIPIVTAAMDTLPESYRTAALLAWVEGFTYDEIARDMSCPIGTVMSRVFRARKRLQKELNRRVPDPASPLPEAAPERTVVEHPRAA